MVLRNYALACRKHTNNITSRKVTMANKIIRDKSRCSECLSDKSRFMKQKHNSDHKYYKTNRLTYCLMCKKNTKITDAKTMKTKNSRIFYHQNVVYVAVKNQHL